MNKYNLPYNPEKLPRELNKYYFSASQNEIEEMLSAINEKSYSDLFKHIPEDVKFNEVPKVTERLEYGDLVNHVNELANKNNIYPSFIGDGLKDYIEHPIVPFVSAIRGLTTAYTPYQPERSQGTLQTLWLYSSSLRMLTGFEAINASFYERSTCLYEAISTGIRIHKKSKVALVSETIYPEDIEVLKTLAIETDLIIDFVKVNNETGQICQKDIKEKLNKHDNNVAVLCFPQVNNFGVLEDVNLLTDICEDKNIQSVCLIDPMLLATKGLKAPSEFGTNSNGCNMIVGEGQHLAIGPNYGGPGLGIFGIRFNSENKLAIRSTAGRFIGKAKDESGQDCLTMVLSTREQHIRRERATSNICSNQSFLASIAGAAILARGEKGMTNSCLTGNENLSTFLGQIKNIDKAELAFTSSSYNEITLKIDTNAADLIKIASEQKLHLGVDVSNRISNKSQYLLISFSDKQTKEDINFLSNFLLKQLGEKGSENNFKQNIPTDLLRESKVGLPNFTYEELCSYYTELGNQNVSPDDNIYPLGSCTMKYNPYINDYAASLKGFTEIHPQAPEVDAQGSLEILYEIQEMFKGITGLPGVTTQPVAGAQGELLGLKLFQAYHRENGNGETKNIILIPRSAHGTNPATATMAGFSTKKINGENVGIVTIEAKENGMINFEQLQESVEKYGQRVAGIMVTNPNTSGIFEVDFKKMSELIHSVDGLVYMDGANMNAIANWVDLDKLGVDAVHNNLHKTWTIPHGGGGPGDAIVAVSEKLIKFLPGIQVKKENNIFSTFKTEKSIGSFHRHFGNFGHKIRCYTYLKALGDQGILEMSALAVLSAKYLYNQLNTVFPTLPAGGHDEPRMHEFIVTISKETFNKIEKAGTTKNQAIAKIGKLFLDFGMHAPTVAFPEQFGLMIEPTESFSKEELDRFIEIMKQINLIIQENPEVLTSVPHFTPVSKVDEVSANKNLCLSENLSSLPGILKNKIEPGLLNTLSVAEISKKINEAHRANQ